MQDDTMPSISPELQAEFDDWEALSDEIMRKFEDWEYEDKAKTETVSCPGEPCSSGHGSLKQIQ